jgi:hexosaminidase
LSLYSEKGAFHPSLMVYDQTFVAEVQDYARKRGIRVVAEFDTPGHTLAWGLGNPDLLTRCYDVPMLEWGPIDPTKNSTYTFIFKLFEEIKQVFKDEYIHLGGDEVDFACWKSNPEINDFMKEHGMEGNYEALQSYYVQKLIDHVASLGLAPMVWEEVFTNGVEMPKSTIVEVWIRDDPKGVLANVTADGHPAIVSAYWYLDQMSNGGDWGKFYNVDLLDFPGDDEQKKLVLGGETCMWAEVVNEYNLESRIWPRACAPAEKLWSAAEPTGTELWDLLPVAERLQEHTCRLNRRGIGAQPPTAPSVCF